MKKIKILIPLIILLFSSLIAINIYSKMIAIEYLQVLSIYNQRTFDEHKARLYILTKDKIFKQDSYSSKLPPLTYRVLSIKCIETNFINKSKYKIRLQLNQEIDVNLLISIKNFKVIDASAEGGSW